jgi:hypothetical protein
MFGLKRMHRQRKHLYERTQRLGKRAKLSRENAIDDVLDKATSPAGLIASFALGASTQLDITKKIRKSLLNGASRDVLSFLSTQVMAYMATEAPKTPTKEENTSVYQPPAMPAQDPTVPFEEDTDQQSVKETIPRY